jgi:E3 ubiquitin-protein ligase RNF25
MEEDDLGIELEALRATYDGLAAARRGGGALVGLRLEPRGAAARLEGGETAPNKHQAFVAAALELDVPPGYPADPPGVALADVRGLPVAAAAAILSALRDEAAALAGEPFSLGTVIESALALITEADRPDGDCSFCLQPLAGDNEGGDGVDGGGIDSGAPAFAVLPCWHSFHRCCAAAWFAWEQARLAEVERTTTAELGPLAAARLAELGVRAEAVAAPDGGAPRLFAVRCPSCRAEAAPAALAPALPALLAPRRDAPWARGGAAPAAAAGVDAAALRELQRRFASALELQRARGGLVDESAGVSLAEMQAAEEAARCEAAAAAAAEAAAVAAAAAPRPPPRQAAARPRGSGKTAAAAAPRPTPASAPAEGARRGGGGGRRGRGARGGRGGAKTKGGAPPRGRGGGGGSAKPPPPPP